jgi:hypothetical protein
MVYKTFYSSVLSLHFNESDSCLRFSQLLLTVFEDLECQSASWFSLSLSYHW